LNISRFARTALLCLAASFLPINSFVAQAATVPAGACLYALDATADRAFQIAGAQSVYTACGAVSESSASDGFEMEGAETLYLQNHSQVSVVGGAQLNGQTDLWDTISNKQVQPVKVTSPGDPLASIAAPTSGTVVSKSHASFDMNNKPANNTLSPGVYCGGLTIGNTNGATFTMSPGVYIMAGGGLTLNSQAVVNGTGVTVYNTSSAGWGCSSSYSYTPVTISGQVTATLSAPTSGAFNGILFFGNRTGCATAGSCQDQINGGSTVVFNGALYFKSDQITISGSSASGYMMLVADKIDINGNSTFGINGDPFDNITVSVSPSTSLLYAGQTQQFTATTNSANTAVTWTISPAGVGTINTSGLYTAPATISAQQTVTVTATSQADTSKSSTATVTLTVNKTTPTITWATPAAITYGTALSATQLDATSTVAGTFAYTPAAGTVLAAGSQTLSVTFTPTNTTLYNTAAATVALTVSKATPTISWATPAAITYGTALSATQLDATSTVAGTFAYTPAAGTVLTAGSQNLSVTFTPINTTEYNTATASVQLTIGKAAATVTLGSLAQTYTGSALSATASTVPNGLTVNFTYNGISTAPTAAGSYTVVGTISDSNYQGSNTGTLVIGKAAAAITWATPTAITYGTALSGIQLNASSTVAGTYIYTPSVGTVLAAGSQTLSVTFTPTDSTDYTTATSTVQLTVNQAQCGSSGYSYQRAITIDHTKVPNTDQANFPFLFNTTDPAFATTANGGHVTSSTGNDIIFSTDPNGLTKLDHELEEYNPVTGQVIAWVRIPTLSHTTDTVLYVFYGNTSITTSQQNPTGVWDNNYMGVWHVANNGGQLSLVDSTSNANNATNNGATSTVGQIDGGMQTDGSTYATIGTPSSLANLAQGNATFSAWVNTATGAGGRIMGKDDNNGSVGWALSLNANNNVDFVVVYSSYDFRLYSSGIVGNAMWSYVTVTLAGSATQSGQATIFINGLPSGSGTGGTGQTGDDSAQTAFLANSTYGDQVSSPLNGSADEFRISNVIRSRDWISTEYNNQSSPATFYQLSNENPVIVTPSTAILYGLQSQQFNTSCSGSIIWSLSPAGLGTLTTSGLYTAPATISMQQTVTITATSQADPNSSASATITLEPPVAVSVTPASVTLYGSWTQQFAAVVTNAKNSAVTWTISPAGVGTINSSGQYTAPATVLTQQTVTIIATSLAEPTQSGSATVTLTPTQCASSYQRAITIDHTKIPNTDQTNFPFLFSTTDQAFATIANGGHVASPNGNDIVFSADPNGLTKLDYELEQYNPATGQIVAWVRIPTLSHTADTVLYMFYGNSSITTSQQNPSGVWDSNYLDVLHLDEATGTTIFDSTVNGNNGTKVSQSSPLATASGEIGGAQAFNGTSDFIALPPAMTGGLTVFSVSFWTNSTDLGNNGTYWNRPQFVGDSTYGGSSGDFGVNTNSGNLGIWSGLNGGSDNSLVSGNYISDNTWHRIDAVNNGSSIELYLDGADTGQTLSSGLALDSYGWYLGAQHDQGVGAAFFHQGNLDEFRFSNSARSSDWIAAEYRNQSLPAAFYRLSPEGLDSTTQITPAAVNLYAAQNQQFAMLGMGTCNLVASNWTIEPADVGTISQTGLYTAPGMIVTQQTVTVTATTPENNNSVSAVVTLLPSWSGPAGTVITINGSGGFGSAEGANSVTVGGLPAMTLFWSDTQIQIQIPTGTGLGIRSVVIAVVGQPNTVATFTVTPGLVGITPPATGLSASTATDLPNQVVPLLFNGTAGQLASVLGSNFNFAGFLQGANISILNPDGTTLVTTSMCGALNLGCNLFLNPVTLPTTGIYTLLLAQGAGSDTVTLNLFQNQTGTIISGVPVNTTINILGQEDLLTFSGTAGQLASVQLSNYNFTGIGFLPSVGISILNPDGTTLVSTWMCGALNLGCNLFLNPVTLPTTGTYTLVIAPGAGTGSGTVLLTLTYPNVKISASLSPVESWFSYPVAVNVALTTKSGQVPTGSVACSGAGVSSAWVTVNANGSATVPMNGLPLGKDSIVCSYASNNLVNFSNAVSSAMIETVTALPTTGSVSVTPASTTLYGGQIQQFNASVFNTSNQAVTWTVSPVGTGTISATGMYAAPASITSQQAVTVTATSQADTTQSASAMITLTPPQCASSGYSYQRSIVIDHTKVPNTDQTDFPFLFNTTDPSFATVANGGHVSSSSGYDIIFSTDPGGLTKLNHELEQYDPVRGQVIAWVRIPTLSHTTDTVLYVFYGNSNVATTQQNSTGVWDSNYQAVYHLANVGTGLAADSTANLNTGDLTSVSMASGEIDGAAGFNGLSSYLQIPSADFASYPTSGPTSTGFSTSFGIWFRTASTGVILGQTDGTAPGGNPSQWQPALYIDNAGLLRASLFSHGGTSNQIVTATAYNDNNWHSVVDTYTNGTEELYVDGQFAGSQQVAEVGYSSAYSYFVGTGETANWPAANGSWLYFNGALDEVNISNIARSSDWVQTEYSNQSSPSTFYALHPENAEEVTPGAVSLKTSQSQQFTVLGSVAGTCKSPDVTWSMPSGMPGTLSANGLYTAPNSISTQLTVPITATTLGNSSKSISATVTLTPAITVSVTPGSITLNAGQTQQFTAKVSNTSNTAVTWTINPAGGGTISTTGLFTAAAGVATQLTMNVTATSQADPTQSASATITLSPTPVSITPPSSCGSSGYSYQSTIVIDHTKIQNTDQNDFPFLFNTTNPSLATIANGGQVANSNGYDIIFSLDPNGLTKLDHELESYSPLTGQVTAWVRIPTLSHTTDTVLYVFYGNPNTVASQQNPTGVWDSNYTAVYHIANTGTGTAADSTSYGNNGTLTSVSAASGVIDGAGSFNGTSSSMQIPETDFPNVPPGVYNNIGALPGTSTTTTFSATFGIWFKTASAGGILGQTAGTTCTDEIMGVCLFTGPMQAGNLPDGSWSSLIYVNDYGQLSAGGLVSPNAYNDNNWHFAVYTAATSGVNELYVDGQNVGSGHGGWGGYSPDYAYFVGAAFTDQSSLANWNWLYFNGNIDEVTVSDIPRSADWIKTEYNNQSSPSTFYTFNPSSTVLVVPSAISLYASQSQQFAATTACDSPVSWSMPSGTQGTLTSSGLYTAPAEISLPQSAVITAKNQTNGSTIGSAVVTLLPPPLPITLAAAAQPPYVIGSTQTFVASLKDQSGTPEPGVSVSFTVSGANSIFGSEITDNNGNASFTYTGANSGDDTIQAMAVVSGQALNSKSVSVLWIVPTPSTQVANVTLTAPPSIGITGLVGVFTDNTGKVIEPIAIGAAPETFVVPAGATQLQLGINDTYFADNIGPGFVVAVNGVSKTVPPTAMPWIWVTGGLNNNYQYGIYAPNIQNGVLDGTSPVVAATALTQGESISIAYQSGTVSTNSATRLPVTADGDQTQITGVEQFQGTYFPTMYMTPSSYPVGQPISFNALVTDATGTPLPNIPVTLNITGANALQLQAMTDFTGTAAFLYSGSNPGTDSLQAETVPSGGQGFVSSQASITWITYADPPSPGSIQLQFIATVEYRQGYDVLVTDASGSPVFNANSALYVWGTDNFINTGTTDTTGHAMFNYFHTNSGAYNLVAVESANRNITFSNAINGTWTVPTTTGSCGYCNTINISVSVPGTITMPNKLLLSGTVTDTVGITPTITWSLISGPGTVIFDNPNQASTSASFSQFGIYVLQISASDSGVSASEQVTVTVYPAPIPASSTDWGGSPLFGATISGVVPIILPPGDTLQSGTLTYFPVDNMNSVTVLNPSTVGSGQIGTLDTTTLVNGSYWIELQATDVKGNPQNDLVQVTVAGNYKPGRVTASVTDLIVPATGLAINIQRQYDSLNAGTSGDFGYGWNLGINTNLTTDASDNVTFTLGGQRKTFYFTPGIIQCSQNIFAGAGCFQIFDETWASYTAEPGLGGTLTPQLDQSLCPLGLMARDGNMWLCSTGELYSPLGYTYTDPSGTQYSINANGALHSITDIGGNSLTVTPLGITSSTGLSVPFVRDASNRITQITDPQGNIYQYAYDGSGNLASVTYPPATQTSALCPNTTLPNTSTYTYDSNHLYTGGTDALCHVLPSTAYFPSGKLDANGNSMAGRLQSVTDAMGNTTSYEYLIATAPSTSSTTTVHYPLDANGNSSSAVMTYDGYGMLLSTKDPLGLITTNVYDVNHNLISVTDPLGHTNSYTYDSNGNKTSSTYPVVTQGVNTTSYTAYNQYSEPTSTTDELGNVRTFNYDASYNPQSVTDTINGAPATLASFIFNANGTLQAGAIGYDITAQPSMASQFSYDANGNMTGRIDALGRFTSYTYDALGNKLTTTLPLPNSNSSATSATTTYSYDAFGHLTQTAAPLGRTTGSTYDANGNKTSDTDARGNVTSYQYDALNRLTVTTYPTNPVTTSTKSYDFRNNVIDETDQAGHITHHVYDLSGRQTSITKGFGTPQASTTSFTYYDDGRKHSETDALNHTTTYLYDASGRLTSIAGPKGSFTYAYDAAGNRISSADGNGNATTFQYDARKGLVKTVYPDKTSTTNSYDGPGNLASVTDQAGKTVNYTYDAANQLQSVIQTNSPNTAHTTSYGYDPLGNLASLTDANSHSTQNLFDVFSDITNKTLPDGSLQESRTYDSSGNLTQLTHFSGKTTTYAYDALNRLTTRTPDPTLVTEPVVSYTYTPTGKHASTTDASGTTTYVYDALDRQTAKITPEGTLNYTFDLASNVASIYSSSVHGASMSYTYDSLNRLSTVVDNNLPAGQNTTTYAYDTASNLVTVTYPNGLQSTIQYDSLNRLTSLASSTASYNYQLGATGNRTGATEQSGRTLAWNYDGIYRLTSEAVGNDPSGGNGEVDYTLDPVGNRTSTNSSLPGVHSVALSGFNLDDWLSPETYDANGNTLTTGGKTFAYDSENHLMSMNGGAVTMIYDGFGNRVSKTVGNVTTKYLVEDDVNPTGLPQVFEESVNGVVLRTYTYGLQRISENQVINNAWTTSFYGYDGFGSVRQLTNLSGTITDTYNYDAFGNLLSSPGPTPNNYLYRGEQYDPDLGLYYLRARYYNPQTGRFLSRDPEDGKAVDPASLHKYLYAGGNPVNRIDPSGKDDFLEYMGKVSDFLSLYNHANNPNLYAQCQGGVYAGIASVLVDPAQSEEVINALGPAEETCVEDLLNGIISPIPNPPWN